MTLADDAMRIGLDGLPDAVHNRVAIAYRAFGGKFASTVSVPALRAALQKVRREEQVSGRVAHANELTRREDVLELKTVSRRGLISG